MCVNFIHKWRRLQFKVDSERQIFEETFHGNFIWLSRVFARNLLRGNRRRNTFRISFWCLAWDSNPGFSSNKPTHYLLDHGDFETHTTFKKPMKKMCINVSNFYMKIINNKYTLLYNGPTIHLIQRYNGLCELINYINVGISFQSTLISFVVSCMLYRIHFGCLWTLYCVFGIPNVFFFGIQTIW